MAWKLRKDKLQAKTPQEETNGSESAAPPLENETIPPNPFLQPEEVASSPPLPEPVSSAVSSPVELSETSVPKELPASGLRWRSRSSKTEAPPADEPIMPAPIVAAVDESHPFLPPEAAPAAHKFSPMDFREPAFQPDPMPSAEGEEEDRPRVSISEETSQEEGPQQDAPALLELPQNWEMENDPASSTALAEPPAPASVEEPHFAALDFTPLDFTPSIPLAEANILAEDHTEASEEPLFSPMPTPGGNTFLPLNAAAHTEPQEEPFFPLPPLHDNTFHDNTFHVNSTDEMATVAGEGGVEEPHFLSTEPLVVPTAEVEEPLFAPLPDWNSFPLPEATAEPEAEATEAETLPPPPLPTEDTSPFLRPEAVDSPPAFSEMPPFEEQQAQTEPQVGYEAVELSPFAPYQPQEHPLPEPLGSKAALLPADVEEPELAPPPPALAFAVPPAFAPPPAFVAPLDADDELDAEREAIAPSLILPETGTGVPRVAPFIVDVPLPAQEAPSVSGMVTLRIGKLSASYPVTKEATVIGRPDSKVQSYPDIEIELDDAVSRRHSEVRHHDDAYFVVDLMSTNGTMLNGEKLDPYKEYPLAPGDRIRIGDRTELIFE